MRLRATLAMLVAVTVLPLASHAADPAPSVDRSVDPVVLTGGQFPAWSAGPDPTLREPQAANDPLGLQSDCAAQGAHNCYESSRIPRNPREGVAVNKILGFRWSPQARKFVQVPFQVDERFTRYLTNNASGFAFYSAADQHNTYAFDREGFRYTSDASAAGGSVCLAKPAVGSTIVNGYATTPDPVKGLDDDDELVFMARDAGPEAPSGTPLPNGITSAHKVAVADPLDPDGQKYIYVMTGNRKPSYTANNGYVRYARDAVSDTFVYSQSSYGSYGAAPSGQYCTAGAPTTVAGTGQRRPLDWASVKTERYKFRYEGRWLMTGLQVSPNDQGLSSDNYGPDMIDQWKARAFQQRPGGKTPCCGYEEEVNNWGGSSILMGERWGPVRAIRETWGADSSTNNARRELFYRDQILFGDALRVHVIPPFDGIYVQWDYNAGKVNRYYNPQNTAGVPIDGKNDESFGNTYMEITSDGVRVRDDDPVPVTGPLDISLPPGGGSGDCSLFIRDGVCNDIDITDPTFSGAQGNLQWEEITGPHGTVVTRWTLRDVTPGGAAQSVFAMPYYRDDSCFDDGTGSDPGPHLRSRNVDDGPYGLFTDTDGIDKPRVCWTTADGDPALDPAGPRKFWQGDIGTHGLHLLFIAESDNAATTLPLTEIDSEQRMVVLPGGVGNVGERYGRSVEYPLRVAVAPYV